MEKWRGKSALVTGANSGIGAAITKRLLKLGMVVAGLDKQTDYLNVSTYFLETFDIIVLSKNRKVTNDLFPHYYLF